jgi:glutamate dehydrogenase
LLPPTERALFDQRAARFVGTGIPPELASRAAGVIFLTTALEIGDLTERAARPVDQTARVFYGVGARFALDEMRDAARRLPAETIWQKQAVESVIDDLYALQSDLATRVLQSGVDGADPVAAWADSRGAALAPADTIAAELRSASTPDLAMLVVASRQLRQALA